MDFIDLEYLVTLAEHKNFTRAAKELHVAQPNLSNCVLKIEQKTGFAIFIRGKQGLTLTPEGEQYIKSANKILEMKQAMEHEMDALSSGHLGQLHLGISPYLHSCILPDFLPAFSQKYPDIKVVVETLLPGQLNDRLREESLEIAIMVEGKCTPNYLCQTVYYEPIVLAVSPDSAIITKGVSVDESEFPILPSSILDGADFVLPEPNSWLRNTAETFFKENKIKPNEIVSSANIAALNRMAAMGVGIAFVPYTFAQTNNQIPAPSYFLGEKGPESWKVCLYIRRDLEELAYIKTFINELKDNF